MTYTIKTTISTVLLLVLYSCTKEISVDVPYQPTTIIYGNISTDNTPVVINIQQSVPLNSTATHNPINNAMVQLYTKNNMGTTSLVTDSFSITNGVYTSTSSINTVIGHFYWIEIILADGTVFNSKEELLKPIVPIISIEPSASADDIATINFNDPANDTNYYKFNIELYFNGQFVSNNSSLSNDVVFNGNSEASVDIDLFKYQDEDEEDEFDFEYDEVRVSFSNINFSSYQFYLNQSLQIEAFEGDESGDPSQLFASPPINLLGNITNISANSIALGNFTVEAKSTVIE
ncbi:MAG: hypothetical protein COA88_08470 [Kordia sp.]|nr:MAG: hypothetical protein COA88_08470 [Kordia sp.]